MKGTLFPLDEANRRLPLVRAITRDAVSHYRAAKKAIASLGRIKARAKAGFSDAEEELARHDATIAEHLSKLRRLIDEIEELGCHLRDYERGVVDFPAACLDSNGFVAYCWSLEEDRVSHWHAEHESFDERRLVATAS